MKARKMKGISPLLASILLIAITVAVASMASGWFTSTIRASTASTTNRTTTALDCSGASIAIDNLFITGTTGFGSAAKAIVRNNGQVDGLTILSAQLYNTTGANFTASSMPITSVNAGTIITLSIPQTNFSACPASFSRLVVTTNCGGISDTFTGTPVCR
ncbi:MAG: hypothetical protein HY365_01855 [Candidatus Aenigmarchaeota archaeon]|nr:hypothetical protein [Candidatus Aenigmarchaeota archaeon]